MLFARLMPILGWAICPNAVGASSNVVMRTRNAPGTTDVDTFRTIRRAVDGVRLRGRDTVIQGNTTIAKSWDGAVLYSYKAETEKNVAKGNLTASAGVDIICKTCYVKSHITASFTVNGTFNASTAISSFADEVKEDVVNITKSAVDGIETYLEQTAGNIFKNGFDALDIHNLPALPTINSSFNLDDVQGVPGCHLHFQFDDTELYMAIDTRLSGGATYNLNLYSSETPIGLAVGNDVEVGVVFSIDLILTVAAQIDVTSGFHLKLKDGLAIDITMFEKNISGITFPGGQFEFLPIEITGSGSITAVLRVGVHSGIKVDDFSLGKFKAGTGIDFSVYANVAEFGTYVDGSSVADDKGCHLRVREEYTLALGAAAGATLVLGTHTWGPHPETTIPIWYTTLADICAVQKTVAATTTTASIPAVTGRGFGRALLLGRQNNMVTTTVSTTATFTGVNCASSTLVDCPVSLQQTTTYKSVLSTVLTVPSGTKPTFPASTFASILSTVPFGKNAKDLVASTGAPVSFTPPPPPPPPPTTTPSIFGNNGTVAGIDLSNINNSQKLIIGLSVGLGVPFLIAVAVGAYCLMRRRKYAPVSQPMYVGQDIPAPDPYVPNPKDAKEPFRVQVTEAS